MPLKLTQDNRPMVIDTPLGKDVVLLRGFAGQEEISRLFRFEIDLVSQQPTVAFKSIVGRGVTITLKMSDGTETYLNGLINRFSQGANLSGDPGLTVFKAEMVPFFWLLTQNEDCRIFQNLPVSEIIPKVLGLAGLRDYKLKLQKTYPKLVYCVQYRESDFNFLSRLMEQFGIFYYFEHANGSHQLVISDSGSDHQVCPGHAKVRYQRNVGMISADEDVVTGWLHEESVRPSAAALADYNFETPANNLRVSLPGTQSGPIKSEVYDYPGKYLIVPEGEALVQSRLEADEANLVLVTGDGVCRGFRCGYRFQLKDHYRDDLNAQYVLTSVTHMATEGAYESGGDTHFDYKNEFKAIPFSVPFRPPRTTPRPIIPSTQTAVVVGTSGEEIWSDKYGRIKVQFHWDREGKRDDNSSCWIRVASPWAGKRWGVEFTPRIGQEVVVAFLEGDPDRPLVVGSVYNADQMPPYEMPANQTRSTIKSNSSKGGDGFNEIRFEDKKGKEQIFVHAERNMDARTKNDCMESVVNDRHLTVGTAEGGKKGDQMEMVYRDKFLKVHRNRVEHVGGDMQWLIGGIDGPGNQDIVISAKKKETIESDSNLHVKADRNEKVDGNQSLTVGGSQQEKVGMKHAVEAGQEIHLKAGMKVVIEAGMQLTLKGPGGFVDIGPMGVTIQGTMVLINSGGAAGAGSGSSPTAPEDATPAVPTEPAVADDDKSGSVSRS